MNDYIKVSLAGAALVAALVVRLPQPKNYELTSEDRASLQEMDGLCDRYIKDVSIVTSNAKEIISYLKPHELVVRRDQLEAKASKRLGVAVVLSQTPNGWVFWANKPQPDPKGH